MTRYAKHPCDKCGRLITQGYHKDGLSYCKRCYDKLYRDNWLNTVIKLEEVRR